MIACAYKPFSGFASTRPGTARTEEYREMPSLAVVAGALLLRLGSAAPPRAPARGGIKLSSCPKGGSSPAAVHDDSEAGVETFARDYEISTSYENGSTCGAQAGENGLDGAFPRRALASTDAATKSWLQLHKSSGAVYADAFDSETIKGAATAELVANKYQAGGGHALMKGVVKRFFNEKEVTSTLVMDALYCGCRALDVGDMPPAEAAKLSSKPNRAVWLSIAQNKVRLVFFVSSRF